MKPKENLLPVVTATTAARYMADGARKNAEGYDIREATGDTESLLRRNPVLFQAGGAYAIASGNMMTFMAGFTLAVTLLEAQAMADVLAELEVAAK